MRTGIDEGWVWFAYNFYPDAKKLPWLKRITPECMYQRLHDLQTKMEDSFLHARVGFNFTKQGYFAVYIERIKENWNNETFPMKATGLEAEIQFTKWLRLGTSLREGDSIFYEADPSFTGEGYTGSFYFTLQPNKNLDQYFKISHAELSKDAEKLYNIDILYSRTTYQFNKYFFLRAIIQYNSYLEKVLTDFLASFTLIPGTVLHVGYGGLYDRREWQNDHWIVGQGDLLNIKRSFFFKASYLWRF
jgi:hypothetical protein